MLVLTWHKTIGNPQTIEIVSVKHLHLPHYLIKKSRKCAMAFKKAMAPILSLGTILQMVELRVTCLLIYLVNSVILHNSFGFP